MKDIILQLNNLSIGFKKIIFSNINATVYQGTITALMGINGAGKSCLLKTIGRLIPSHNGSVLISQIDINNYQALDFAKLTSLVLTEKFQVDYLRVDELIYLGRSPYTNWLGQIEKNDQEIVVKIMEQVGILNLADSFFSELSDGQKQKVLIARALAQEPSVLILDEPTTYLDIPSKIELLKLLKGIAVENKVAIIMSTHDLELVENHVDQVWLMGQDGSFNVGSPASLRSLGIFQKHFFAALN